MRIGILMAINISLSISNVYGTDIVSPSIFSPPPMQRFDVSTVAQYRKVRLEMKYLVAKTGRQDSVNNFCIVGYKFDGGREASVVYWAEVGDFYIWDGSNDWGLAADDYRKAQSLYFTKSYNIHTGVVDTEEDLSGSTYLMLRKDVEGTVTDCQKSGEHYTIEPFAPLKEDE